MADNKITLLSHLKLLAMRCSSQVTSKVAELATTVTEALEEMDEVKADKTVATTSANGLMSSSDKSKLNGISAGANKTVVDSSMSSTSTNPVQNKVISAALDQKSHVQIVTWEDGD